MTSLLDSPPQIPANGAWGSLYAAQEPSKSRSVWALPPAASKKPAYGVKRNLEMCTEALGCETGAVDTAADYFDDDGGAERKRRAREDETKAEAIEGRERRALPPPLTTLAPGARRVRMVHERRDGRLEVYAVPASGMEAERSGGRLRLRFLRCDSCGAAAGCSQQEPRDAEEQLETREADQEEFGAGKYVRGGGRCIEAESGAMAARRVKKWAPEQPAAFWVAIS